MKFVENANLPSSRVTLAVADAEIKDAIVIAPCEIETLSFPLSRHADLGLCHLGGKAIVCAKETCDYYKKQLDGFGFDIICGGSVGSTYPRDSAYNVAMIGRTAVLNEKACDGVLYREILERGFDIVNVGQGYAKCSIAIVSQLAVITADKGIADALLKRGFDVCLIQSGGVSLSGFDYGFIGGAAGKTDRDELFVNGSLSHHGDAGKIYAFLEKHGVRAVENKGECIDIGSILPLGEI